MAWTSPRTWVSGEVPPATTWNTHVRDNFKAIGDAWTAWTPTVTASSGTFTTVSGTGRYISVGKLTIWSATITITTVGTAAGFLQFTLPVTAQAATGYIGDGRSPALTSAIVFLNTTTQARVSDYAGATVCTVGTLVMSGSYEAA